MGITRENDPHDPKTWVFKKNDVWIAGYDFSRNLYRIFEVTETHVKWVGGWNTKKFFANTTAKPL